MPCAYRLITSLSKDSYSLRLSALHSRRSFLRRGSNLLSDLRRSFLKPARCLRMASHRKSGEETLPAAYPEALRSLLRSSPSFPSAPSAHAANALSIPAPSPLLQARHYSGLSFGGFCRSRHSS